MTHPGYGRRTRNILNSKGLRSDFNKLRARKWLGVDSPSDIHWRDDAACTSEPPETFFTEHPREAKKICRTCPVVAECLAAHLFEPYGVFGGKTPGERGTYRKNLANKRTR